MQQKSKFVTFILCWLFGVLGVHRFYTGKVGTGILWLLTGGFFGVGVIVDMLLILCNSFRDKQGQYLRIDVPTILIVVLFIFWFVLCSVLGVFGFVLNSLSSLLMF